MVRCIFVMLSLLAAWECGAKTLSPNIVFIGNSITHGAQHADWTKTAPPNACAQWLSEQDSIGNVHFLNVGKSGKTTFHFLPDRNKVIPEGDPSYFNEVVERTQQLVAAHADQPLIFSIMLGTNDSAERPRNHATSKAQYVENMTSIIDSLLTLWPDAHVLLNRVIYYTPGFVTQHGTVMDDQALERIRDYYDSYDEIIAKSKKGRVHIGDTRAYDYFKKNWKTDIVEEKDRDGRSYWLHPNEKGAKALGEYWGKAILLLLSAMGADTTESVSHTGVSNHEKTPVYIVVGQSNADGRASMTEMPEIIQKYVDSGGEADILMSYCNGMTRRKLGEFEPYVPMYEGNSSERCGFDAILYSMMADRSQKPIYVMKESKGGTAIDTLCTSSGNLFWCADEDWMERSGMAEYHRETKITTGQSLLMQLEANIDACIKSTLSKLPGGYEIKCIVWHQGESDRPRGQKYYENLKKLISHLRKHIAEATGEESYLSLPFIAGGVSKDSRQYNPEVEKAKERLAAEDQNVYYVNMDGCELRSDDRLHFNGNGCREAALRLFELIQDIPL